MDPGRSLSDDESHYTYKPSKESHIVIISYPFPSSDEIPQSTFVGETISDSITITNTTSKPLHLLSVKINGSEPENSFTLSTTKPPTADDDDVERLRVFMEAATLEEDRVLKTDKPLTIWLSCKPKEIGLHTASISFNVGDKIIKRRVTLLADNKISHSLSSSKPYNKSTRKKKNVVDLVEKIVVGVRPFKGSNGRFRCRLPQYRIPADIRQMINKGQINGAVSEGLSFENYGSFFKNLLAMEEMKMEEDMGAYNMECAAMKRGKRKDLLSLKVEGLDEKRPSLVIGDFIIVKVNGGENSKSAHQGYIHQVGTKEIYLKFDKKFHQSHKEGNLYNVQFTYNRSGIRRLYDAVKAAEKLDKNFLFPCKKGKFNMKQVSKKLVPISCNLDDKQARAVKTILSHLGGLPYVIHGPPGTGKTITLVEAMLQIYCAKQKARMLVCAPSNCAADHILELLINQESVQIKDDILRLNAYTRPFDDVDPKHVDYCCFEDYVFSCPSLEELAQYRIIISTNTSAYLLYSEGLGRGHFSYFFLDEAGRALEPETMVPLSHLYSKNSVVVLAGDPMQLGPVVFSRDAERYGLGTSYLERLFKCDLYHDGDRHFMTKLVRNYRSHEAILRLPSELFYGGELIPCKEGASFLTSSEDVLFPNKEFPLLFIGIEGRDEREGNNPSWFNRIEASKVVGIIEVLLYERGLNEEDIGVITPYRQQVNKIRGALESVGVANVKIGSVEQFQGQEREVIIISTVRSNVKHKKFDRVHSLGFLSNPKRFNVAITRAKSVLVVIGNPHIMSKDPNWNKLLWYCVDNGSYIGCSLPAREDFTAENSAQTGHTGAQDLKDNSQPSGGNRNKGGDGWWPYEDQWNGNWDEGGYGRPYEDRWNGNGDEGGDGWLPLEDQWGVEEPPYQGASTSVRWGSQDDRYQPSDVPWE